MDTIVLHLIPIVFTMLALGHVRSLAGRRSPMREGLTTAGAIIIIIGLTSKSILMALMTRGIAITTDGMGIVYAVLAAGFVLLMYGFVGWDRMTLTRPGWTKPLLTIAILECTFFVSKHFYPEWWIIEPISVVVGSLIIMDLLLLGYTLRQRYFIASPFIVLHMASIIINTLIEIQGYAYTSVIQGVVLTASTSALLFYIIMRLIERHTYRGRMLIV
jgi:hypothetical protein